MIRNSIFILIIAGFLLTGTALSGTLIGHWTMDDNTTDSIVIDNSGSYNGTFIDPNDSNTSYHHSINRK